MTVRKAQTHTFPSPAFLNNGILHAKKSLDKYKEFLISIQFLTFLLSEITNV